MMAFFFDDADQQNNPMSAITVNSV